MKITVTALVFTFITNQNKDCCCVLTVAASVNMTNKFSELKKYTIENLNSHPLQNNSLSVIVMVIFDPASGKT